MILSLSIQTQYIFQSKTSLTCYRSLKIGLYVVVSNFFLLVPFCVASGYIKKFASLYSGPCTLAPEVLPSPSKSGPQKRFRYSAATLTCW